MASKIKRIYRITAKRAKYHLGKGVGLRTLGRKGDVHPKFKK